MQPVALFVARGEDQDAVLHALQALFLPSFSQCRRGLWTSPRSFSIIFCVHQNQLPTTYLGSGFSLGINGGESNRGPCIQFSVTYLHSGELHSSLLSPYHVLRTSGPNKYIYMTKPYIVCTMQCAECCWGMGREDLDRGRLLEG